MDADEVIRVLVVDDHEVVRRGLHALLDGDLATAARLLGRPVTLTGSVGGVVAGSTPLDFRLPVALPPDGDYAAQVDGRPLRLRIVDGDAYLLGEISNARVTVVLDTL